MKVDKWNPRHWLLLASAGANALAALVMRTILRRRRKLVLLYGHKLGGNLLAIHRFITAERPDIEVAFLTMDPAYHRHLVREGVRSVLVSSPRAISALVHARALVTDHGLHTLLPLLYSDLAFFDTWHAIPFKGFDAADFRVQHRYRETWVASPLLARKYVELYGFPPDRVVVTGYARTDRLVRAAQEERGSLLERLGLPADAGKVVLFAPTWRQDSAERSIFPFGVSADEFCSALSDLACRNGATIVFRTHLNSGEGSVDVSRYPGLKSISYADNPDTEEILLASDVLVCDWSSIAFDFLLLRRPTIFLDVPAPFRKGFTLGPEYRFGEIVAGLPALLRSIEDSLVDPESYSRRHAKTEVSISNDIYGTCADGKAAMRCVGRLDQVLGHDR